MALSFQLSTTPGVHHDIYDDARHNCPCEDYLDALLLHCWNPASLFFSSFKTKYRKKEKLLMGIVTEVRSPPLAAFYSPGNALSYQQIQILPALEQAVIDDP